MSKKSPQISTLYNRHSLPGIAFDRPSRTQEHFAPDCDVNRIMAQFLRTGQMTHLNPATPAYADLGDDISFRDAQAYVIEAEERFLTLPSKIRKRFDNDPARLLDFLGQPDNYDEAVILGLIEPRTSTPLDVTGTTDTKSVTNPASSEAEQKPGA